MNELMELVDAMPSGAFVAAVVAVLTTLEAME